MAPRKTIFARFWAKVEKTEGCWLWTGSLDTHGYGSLFWGGTTRRASRVSLILAGRPPPDGMLVCHTCDNPRCVRPEHLFLGTNLDNARDCIRKGRKVVFRGEAHGRAKLTEEMVRRARERRAAGIIFSKLAKEFGVSKSQIQRAVKGQQWRHLK
jgi:hypothetical protein